MLLNSNRDPIVSPVTAPNIVYCFYLFDIKPVMSVDTSFGSYLYESNIGSKQHKIGSRFLYANLTTNAYVCQEVVAY